MITIPKKIYDVMIEHAKNGYPNEACGILAGSSRAARPPQGAANTDDNVVSDFFPMKNVDESSISYFMDPREQLLIFKKMRQTGIDMKGIFHSHVASEAYPSQKDVRLAFYPGVSYLIVSLSNMKKPRLRSFRIEEEKVTEEEIKLGG